MLQIAILIVAMAAVGLIIGALAGPIWKDKRPIGVTGDYVAAVISAVAIGLLDWFVIPAMGFSTTMRNLGVAMEPALGALVVLWLFRVAKH
jgi:uncharacterized membrane protein YeaQ/YmgE (transglycosylase-associated protein family)